MSAARKAALGDQLRRHRSSGRPHTEETKAKLRNLNVGRKQTPEQVEKMRQTKIGKPLSPAHRSSISHGLRGYQRTENHQEKINAALRARPKINREKPDPPLWGRGRWRRPGNCSICELFVEQLVQDHDHESGRIRDLLCHPCNLALGQFRDDPQVVERAAAYLRRWGKE